MSRETIRLYMALGIVIPFLLAGCSRRVPTYPVSGTVRFEDGEPVRIGFIEFRNSASGRCARAHLNNSGTYSLGTFATNDGAPAGKYGIIIVQYFNAPPSSHVHSHHDEDGDDMTGEHHGHGKHSESSHPDARVDTNFSSYTTSPLRHCAGGREEHIRFRPDASEGTRESSSLTASGRSVRGKRPSRQEVAWLVERMVVSIAATRSVLGLERSGNSSSMPRSQDKKRRC